MRTRGARKEAEASVERADQPVHPTDKAVSIQPTDEQDDEIRRVASARRAIVRKVASVAMVIVFVAALADALQFKGLGKLFPTLAASIGLTVAVVYAVLTLAGKNLGTSAYDIGNEALDGGDDDGIRQWWVLVGLAAFPLLTAALGLVPAVVVWMPAFLIFIARVRWWAGILGTAGALGVLYALQLYIGMVFPGSVFVS